MNPLEKEDIEKLKTDFYKLKKKIKLSKNDEDKIITDVSGLLGIYAVDMNEETAGLIEEMLSFAEKKRIATGSRIEFEQIKKGKIKITKID